MFGEIGPTRHTRDPIARNLSIPGLVEQENPDAGLREGRGDQDVVFAEGVELELLREAHLVFGRPGGVVATARVLRPEIAGGLEMDRLGVVEDALLTQPRFGDVPAAFGARRDEVKLVTGRDEPLEYDGAVLVDLELREEPAVVEADAELIALLLRNAVEARQHAVESRATLLLREKVPPDLALVGKLDVELLSEAPQVGHRANRHDVVEVDAELH